MIRDNFFYGDNMRWWYGTVIDVSADPLQLGRALVRIFGIHGPDIPDEKLPWASVLLPTTSGGVSGVGTTPWLQPTARVIGIFVDGKGSQNPIILGALPAVEGDIAPNGNVSSGTGPTGSGAPGEFYGGGNPTTSTNYVATNLEAREAAEAFYRPLSDEEYSTLIALIFAEASAHQEETAWVAGVILNRARQANSTVMQVANAKGQFHSVTGPVQDRQNYINGPNAKATNRINGALTNFLASVPTNVYFFDSNIVGAYRNVGGRAKYDKVARDRQAAGLSLRVIGQTRFWLGGKGWK